MTRRTTAHWGGLSTSKPACKNFLEGMFFHVGFFFATGADRGDRGRSVHKHRETIAARQFTELYFC
jgi:hypothetical protein